MLKFPVLSFLGTAALFFTATIAAGIYGLDAARLNLWLALGLALALNPLGLGGQKLTAWGLCAGIAALAAVMLPARIWGVWLFAAFMAAGGMLKGFYPLADDNTNNEATIPYGRLIILTAAYFNLSFITNTGHTDVQYDFASCYNYIEYILENDFLFWRENPLLTRPSYSTYHPILHFLLAAGEMRLATVLGAGMLNAGIGADAGAGIMVSGAGANMLLAAEAAQVCFCFYMLWYYFLAGKILRFFRLRTAVYCGALAFVCFFPAYNAIAGFFNNDCLLLPLQAGTVYYSLLYYRDGGRKNLAFILLFATAAALTKLSGIIVLPLTGAAILLRLYQQWKEPENGQRVETKNKQQKSGAENKRQLAETAVFGGLMLAGLAIWPLYQHYFLNVGFDFVPPQEHLSLKGYSLWQRFNPLGALFYPQMFYNDFGINLWETMTKTALFGQWDFSMRGADIMGLITALVLTYKALLVLAVVAVAYLGAKKRQTQALRQTQAFWLTMILLAGILAGQVMFGLKHPYMCNQDFRYVAIITLPVALLLAQFLDKIPETGQRVWGTLACGAGLALIAVFAFLSAFVWWRISF